MAFGLGAAAYLRLKAEPPLWIPLLLGLAGVCGFAAARIFSRRRAATAIAGLVALCACGFLVAKVHADGVAAPIAPPRAV